MSKKTYGIVGHPVKHSLSPAMQNAAFKALDIDAEYRLYDVEPLALDDFLKDIPKNNISGLNVTIPHKIKAKEFLEKNGSLDENAKKLGAVNTIKVEANGSLRGYNTDGPGFYRSLVEDLRFEPEGKTIFVLGAGGAARAVVMYLGNAPKKIFISDVEITKCQELRAHYREYYDDERIAVVNSEDVKEALDKSNLLINATPIGMKDEDGPAVDKSMLHTGLFIYDLVYNKPITRLVREANSLKCHGATGLGMLLYQGAIAFEIWTGVKAPVAVMRKALREALKSNG